MLSWLKDQMRREFFRAEWKRRHDGDYSSDIEISSNGTAYLRDGAVHRRMVKHLRAGLRR